jgi:hypothetical protein
MKQNKDLKIVNRDTGLRASENGDLYLDKKAYFSREDVKGYLRTMRESPAYPKLKEAKK